MLEPPLYPWLQPAFAAALVRNRPHAMLMHAGQGMGAHGLLWHLAKALLCESPDARPCHQCAACHLMAQGAHPDLAVLMPEAVRQDLGWDAPAADDAGDSAKARKKPSKQIRIDEVRRIIEWLSRTSSRARAKVVLVHPAESMNAQAANALLKTLEEPPLGTAMLLSTADPSLLLPTMRSRCQTTMIQRPDQGVACTWLQAQGVTDPHILLTAAAGQPLEALALAKSGLDAGTWVRLPKELLKGQGNVLAGSAVPRVIETLQKLCHDGIALACNAAPHYFPRDALPPPKSAAKVYEFLGDLQRLARHDEHPWNEPLLVDALLTQVRVAWSGQPAC